MSGPSFSLSPAAGAAAQARHRERLALVGRLAGKHYSVAFIPGATGVAFYESLGAGVQAEAKKLGMSYSTQGAADFTPAAQTPVVWAVCSRSPSLLLIAPTDPVAMRPAIQRCMSEGVKVVLVDTGLTDSSGIVSAITSNNIQGGEAAAKVIGKQLHGKGQVSLMSLSPTATTQVQRLQGVKQELKSSYPGISVVSTQYTQQAPTSSETTARSVLSAIRASARSSVPQSPTRRARRRRSSRRARRPSTSAMTPRRPRSRCSRRARSRRWSSSSRCSRETSASSTATTP